MDKSFQELTALYNRYTDNPYITTKIHNYINHTLPNLIENLHKQQIEKEHKKLTPAGQARTRRGP